jgi:beta-1,4-mannosyl-glycoprotein beta-1,4-N-acetylglucosaminyltransferase
MIYDCFTFFNELDLLEIRLNILNEVVDRFVIVEATRTFSNRPKPLYFELNKARFEDFAPKIIHLIVDDYPEFETAWTYENYQRNCIGRCLRHCKEDDIILISDLDEIPNPTTILEHQHEPEITAFEQLWCLYYLNHLFVPKPVWIGTKMLPYHLFKNSLDHVRCNLEKLNQGTTATKIRLYKKSRRLQNGGWHFSYLGGVESIREKIQSYAHQERNYEEFTNLQNIAKRMQQAFTSHRLLGVELDETFPAFLRNNRERYAHLVGPVTPKEIADKVRKTAWLRSMGEQGGFFIAKLLTCLIPVSRWRKWARKYVALHLFGQC